MNDLFYSSTEKILFQIVGYSTVDGTSNVTEIIERLKKEADEFAVIASIDVKEVRSDFISRSQRYKNMRVYYAHADKVPEIAFHLGDGWNMSKWLAG